MNPFDETLLSGYLDDELDPESRLLVEKARRADPRVDRTLRELSRVRGLVAGLPRPPEAPDVSGAVLGQIRRASARRRALPSFAAAAALAAAAILVVPILSRSPDRDRAALVPGDSLAAAPGEATGPGPAAPDTAGPDVASDAAATVGAPSPSPAVLIAEAAGPPRPTPADLGPTPEQAERLRFVLDLIDHPSSRRFTIEAPPGTPVDRLLGELEAILLSTARDDSRYALIQTDRSDTMDAIAFIAGPGERRTLIGLVDAGLGDRAPALEPADGASAEAVALLAGPDGFDLLDAGRPAPLLPGVPDPLVANRQHPHDGPAELPGPAIAPSLPGGLPAVPGVPATGRPDPPPAPSPTAAAPRDEATDVVFIRVLPADAGDE